MTHVQGYTKHDGTIVKPYDTKALPAHQAPKGLLPSHYPNAIKHPQAGDNGEPVTINEPSTPTTLETWSDPSKIATVVPGGSMPAALNGIAFSPWQDAPQTPEDWEDVPGQDPWLIEPEFESIGAPAAGVVIEEPDGRVWVIHPSNKFGGYKSTFPKGRIDHDINMQASAIKEAYEESGLQVEITGFLADVERSVTTCRYYAARRVGGTPADCGWESQAVSLVPRSKLYEVLNSQNDHGLAEALGAGPRPVVEKKPFKK